MTKKTITVLATRPPGMSDDDFLSEVNKACKENGIPPSAVLANRSIKNIGIGDSLAVTAILSGDTDKMIFKYSGSQQTTIPAAAYFLVCLFVSPDKQQDRLADFHELLNTEWIPRFGPRIGSFFCVWHAITSAGAIVKIGIIAAVVDRIKGVFGF